MDTGKGNISKDEDKTAHVDNDGNRIANSDIEHSFDAGDYVGDEYSQGAEVTEITPIISTNKNDKNIGLIANYYVRFNLHEQVYSAWRNNGEEIGLLRTAYSSQYLMPFRTQGFPWVMRGFDAKRMGNMIWEMTTPPMIGEVTRVNQSWGGTRWSSTNTESIGRRIITHETLLYLELFVRNHHRSYDQSIEYKIFKNFTSITEPSNNSTGPSAPKRLRRRK